MWCPFPFELNPEINRTFCSREKKLKLEEQRAKAQEASSTMAREDDQTRTLWDFVTSGAQGITSSIAWPNVEAHNIDLKPTLISMVQQSQFGRTLLEDPNLHVSIFLDVCDMLKLNGVSTDTIRLWLFRFSLRDKARVWLPSLPLGCITMRDKLTKVFHVKFFPPNKTARLRNQMTTFAQREDESLYKAWEYFKDLLRLCLHHCLQW